MLHIHIMMSSKETINKNKSRGVGDSIAEIIKKMSGGRITPCDKCNDRKDILNKWMPYNNDKRKK